jgi:Uma2 family endonuclease
VQPARQLATADDILSLPDEVAAEVVGGTDRPDLVSWRRDRTPERPSGRPVRTRPDWVCEVLSTSNAQNDLVTKFRVYHRCGVPHYWIVDPDNRSLIVYRCEPDGYLAVLTAMAGATVRAEPFDAIELRVGELFGEET